MTVLLVGTIRPGEYIVFWRMTGLIDWDMHGVPHIEDRLFSCDRLRHCFYTCT